MSDIIHDFIYFNPIFNPSDYCDNVHCHLTIGYCTRMCLTCSNQIIPQRPITKELLFVSITDIRKCNMVH